MTSTLSSTTRIAAFSLCVLGCTVLLGWLIGSETLVRVVPGSVAMSINTAVMFLAAGVGLLLSNSGSAQGRRTYRVLAGFLIVLPSMILSQHVFDIDLGIDWASVHAALGDGHSKPGRTAPNACLAFLFSGILFLMGTRKDAGQARRRVATALAIFTFVIGLSAFLGYVLNLEALYQVASYNRMAALTAMGVTMLGVGLWSLQSSATNALDSQKSDEHHITGLSAALLTAFAFATGLTAFGVLKISYEKAAADNLSRTAKTSAIGMSSLLDKTILLSKSVSTRPILKTSLLALAANASDRRAIDNLQAEAKSFLELGFSGAQIWNGDDKLVMSWGSLVGEQATMTTALGTTENLGELVWKDGFLYRSDFDVIEDGKVIGRILTERRLHAFSEFVSEAQAIAATSDVVLCTRDKDLISCFPSRFYKKNITHPLFKPDGTPTLPVARALLGESGSASVKDLRGIAVLAGFTPVPGYPLAVVEKIDNVELYTPLREGLPLLFGAVFLFVTAGTLLLRKWVKPLVAQIVAERRRMKAILNNSNDAFAAIGADGRISDWNIEAERVLGWKADEAIGRDLAKLIIPEGERAARAAGFKGFFSTGAGPLSSRRVEARALRKDGTEIPVELSVASFHDGKGYAASVFMRDLTAQKEAEHELESARTALAQSQKLEAVGKLTGGVAHDFNNVLQVIKGSLQLLQSENEDSYKVQKRVATAASAVDRGAKLSSQLLAFARKQPLQPKVANLARVVREMNEMLQRALGESVEIETITAAGLWNTIADPHQLEHVILNLAINARDAMKGEGKLTIEVGNANLDDDYVKLEPGLTTGQYVMLALSDTGCGMPPEVRERAFEPFFTTKREGEGTGLGLSMAYGFVKQSDGHIRIYSEVGHGTTIKIYLPRSFEKEEQAAVSVIDTVAGGNETVLVVEDDFAVQATAVDLLSGLGYTVLKADNAESAMAILRGGAPVDLLFTDVVMPGAMRSPELAKRAKQLLPDLKVLFTSGYTQNAIVHGGRLDPGVHLLSKPYSREQLARKIRELLCSARPSHAESAETANASAPSVLRIAFVDDNPDFRLLGAEMLSIIGHQVESFATAEDAYERLSTSRFDVLLTDVSLPGMSGIELASATAKAHPGTRIILASGFGEEVLTKADFSYELLPKPFAFEQLREMLSVNEHAEKADLSSIL